MKRDKILSKAVFLRRNGYSIREISEKLDISKSTASVWVREVKILNSGINRLDRLSVEARKKGFKTNKNKKTIF